MFVTVFHSLSGWNGTVCWQWSGCLWRNELSDACTSFWCFNYFLCRIDYSGSLILWACGDTDLVTVMLTEKSIEVAHAAANRWTGKPPTTNVDSPFLWVEIKNSLIGVLLPPLALICKNSDNIFTLRQWCANNFPQAKEQLEHLYNEVYSCFIWLKNELA